MILEMPKESIVFLGGILLSTLLIPLSLPIFRKLGFFDLPNARSSHSTAIPRGTGLVIVVTFVTMVVGYSIVVPGRSLGMGGSLEALLWAVLILLMVGFLDDTRGVSCVAKLIFQLGSAYILALGGFVIPLPEYFGSYQSLVQTGFTVAWIVTVINAVNFIDGSDGLATTLSTLCMLLFVGISRILPREVAEGSENISRTINLLGLAGAGSAVPFLLFNVSPAKCFLGDAGSTFFGLLLAVLGILTTQYYPVHLSLQSSGGFTYTYLLVPWLVLFVPVADAFRVTIGRMLEGKSPFRPDNRHFHHLLHRVGLSPNQILFLVGLLVMISGLIAAILVRSYHGPYLMMGVCLLLVYGLLWFLKSSYQARRFVTLALNRRLLHFMEVTEGFENPATFKEHSEQELARARRHGNSLSVAVVNATGLKLNSKVTNPMENPRFMEGILRTLRREDVKCRFSSDRLAFILVETDKTLADKVCERLQDRFNAVKQGESADLQVGIGFAIYPENGVTIAALLKHAEASALEKMRVGAGVALEERSLGLERGAVDFKEGRGGLAPAPAGGNGSEEIPSPAHLGAEGAMVIPAQASASARPAPPVAVTLGEGQEWPRWVGARQQEPLVPGAARGGERWFDK